jgi:RHS repeat-associated protein
MTYDAENRMVTAASGTQRYRYDANGRRVKRLTGQTGEVWQVYDPDGQLLAEYPKQGAVSVPTKEYGYRGGQMLVVFDSTEAAADDKLKWLVQDHLGSTRMLVNRSGSLSGIKRRDYLPFGEELASTVGHRAASGSGYAVDDKPRQKFGSKERDTETGLDYFLARYYSNTQGRFISVDPENAGAVPDDPQSWNSYAYARNNPVVFSDPDGRKYLICSPDGKECYEHSDEQFYDGRRAGREGGFTYTGDEGFFEKGEIRDKDGNVIATYQQISIDDRAREFAFAMQVSLNDPEIVKRAARNALSSAIIGFFLGRVTGQPRITTRSLSRNAALQEAKLANDIPVSKSPDRVIKPNTAEGSRIGLDNRNVRLYEYTNNKGQKIWIREDNAASYGSPGGAGDQGPHFNSGPAGDQKNLKSHHYWDQ